MWRYYNKSFMENQKRTNCYPLILKMKVISCYLSDQYTINEIVSIFDICKSSIYNWINLYKKGDLHEKMKYKKNSMYTDEIRKYICIYVIKRTNFDYKKLIRIIKDKYNIICKKSSLYKILKDHKITRKRVNIKTNFNKKGSNKKKKELLDTIKHIHKENIISIDESSFDTHINSNYGWSNKGSKIEAIKRRQRIRYSVICAISIKKVIGIKIIKGSVNSIIFREFIESITNKIGKNKVLFMDNARIHHSIIFNEYVKTIDNQVLYNVPYLSELNPIEMCFSKVKSIVRKRHDNENNNKLVKNIKYGFNKIYKSDLHGYFCKSLQI